MTIASERFEMCHFVHDVFTIALVKARQKAVRLEFVIWSGMRDSYVGDCSRLQQMAINLSDNAIKYTPVRPSMILLCEVFPSLFLA